jgi:valyl-tRNA synthetase
MGSYNKDILNSAEIAFEMIQQVRNIRNTQGISPKEPLKLLVETDSFDDYLVFASVVTKLANLDEFGPTAAAVENATSIVINGDSCFIPLGDLIDNEKEIEEITKELDYTRGFLNSVSKKLGNERFVNNAPEQVVANERKKQADAEAKIEALESRLHSLTNA